MMEKDLGISLYELVGFSITFIIIWIIYIFFFTNFYNVILE
jgi:uncharacterized membrane protein